MPVQLSRSRRILVIVDAPGWAHDLKTRNLAQALLPDYEIVERFEKELTRQDLD